MSLAIVEKPVSFEKSRESFLPSQIVSCPQELLPVVTIVERFAADLLVEVGKAVNAVKLKLLLPVKTYSTGTLWWRQSFVLTDDLRKLDVDVSRFAKKHIAEGAAVSVGELEKHGLEVTTDHQHRAKWYASSRTIKISANALHEALHLLLFELTNATSDQKFRSISSLPKSRQVQEYERVEFETVKQVRQRLDEMKSCENFYQYTHRHFDLHYLHQELTGHVGLIEKLVGTQVGTAWPNSMNAEERAVLTSIINLHILYLYGPEDEKERRKTKLDDLTKNLEGNLQKNWVWYEALYGKITREESIR